MNQYKFGDILTFKTPEGVTLGFHTQSMEVAELSHELWDSLAQNVASSEAIQELTAWNKSGADLEQVVYKNDNKIKTLVINITQICNLHCNYCAAGGDGTYGNPITRLDLEKTIPQLVYFLEKLQTGDKFFIKFLGGEPFLYLQGMKAICEFVTDYAQKHGIKASFGVNTNATLINDQAIALITQYKFVMMVSLDGPPEIHDIHRKTKSGKGSSDQVLAGLKKIAEHRDQLSELTISAVYDEQNMDLVKAYQFFSELPADHFEFTFTHLKEDDELNQKYIAQMTEVARLAYEKGGEKELRRIISFDGYFKQLDDQTKTYNFCGAGKNNLVIDAQNKIYTCPWDVESPQESVGQGQNIDPNQLNRYLAPLVETNGCQKCWAKNMCGGGCMYIHKKQTGNKHTPHPDFCFRIQSLIKLAIMYYVKCRSN